MQRQQYGKLELAIGQVREQNRVNAGRAGVGPCMWVQSSTKMVQTDDRIEPGRPRQRGAKQDRVGNK